MQIEAEIARCQKNADWTREAISTEARMLQSVADANDLLASHHDDVKRDLKQCQNDMNAARFGLLLAPLQPTGPSTPILVAPEQI